MVDGVVGLVGSVAWPQLYGPAIGAADLLLLVACLRAARRAPRGRWVWWLMAALAASAAAVALGPGPGPSARLGLTVNSSSPWVLAGAGAAVVIPATVPGTGFRNAPRARRWMMVAASMTGFVAALVLADAILRAGASGSAGQPGVGLGPLPIAVAAALAILGTLWLEDAGTQAPRSSLGWLTVSASLILLAEVLIAPSAATSLQAFVGHVLWVAAPATAAVAAWCACRPDRQRPRTAPVDVYVPLVAGVALLLAWTVDRVILAAQPVVSVLHVGLASLLVVQASLVAIDARRRLARVGRRLAQREAQVDHTRRRLRAMVDASPDPVLILDGADRVLSASASAAPGLGVDPVGLPLHAVVHAPDLGSLIEMLHAARSGEEVAGVTVRVPRPDGSFGIFVAVASTADAATLGGLSLFLRDQTEQHELLVRLAHQSRHDPVTGLPNRQSLRHSLAALADAGPKETTTLAVVDLNRFRGVNDLHGPEVADEVLTEIGRRLTRLPGAFEVSRIGADRFAVVALGRSAHPEECGTAICAAVAEPMRVTGQLLTVTASVGLAPIARGAQPAAPDALLQRAELALTVAKRRGMGRWSVYDPELARLDAESNELSLALGRAVQLRQLRLEYQPLVSLTTLEPVGVEALLRWQPSDGRAVPPSVFVPFAERTGHMAGIGSWVTRQAVADAARLATEGTDVYVSVNVSAVQFDDNPTAGLLDLLETHGVPADRLVVELTETALATDPDGLVARLSALRDLGVRIAIDDFGTGYSSLSVLQQLPADILKIDQAFVRDLPADATARQLVGMMVHVAKTLGLCVIAEGVETQDQLLVLQSLGVDRGQGWLFARPAPLEDLHLPGRHDVEIDLTAVRLSAPPVPQATPLPS